MVKTVLIGCSGVVTPAIDIQVIGVENVEYSHDDVGKTIIRNVFTVTENMVTCDVPISSPSTSRYLNTSSVSVNASHDYDVYFCDSSSNNVTIVLDDITTVITVVAVSASNEVRVVHSTKNVDTDPMGKIITYLSPKTILYDGTNYWTK